MSITEKETFRIPVKEGQRILSLCWRGAELVDLASGGTRYRLDGTVELPGVFFAYHFNRAVVSNDGNYSVIYEALGTKGLVLRGNKPVREINRSFYHAHVYEYPFAIIHLPDGRTAIAHCPDAYNKIKIEEIESGQRLTAREGDAADFFHSRLQATPDSEFIIGFHEHPKLIEIASGKVVKRWSELDSGKQNSSIIWHEEKLPPLALDSNRMRFAVADSKGITAVQLAEN